MLIVRYKALVVLSFVLVLIFSTLSKFKLGAFSISEILIFFVSFCFLALYRKVRVDAWGVAFFGFVVFSFILSVLREGTHFSVLKLLVPLFFVISISAAVGRIGVLGLSKVVIYVLIYCVVSQLIVVAIFYLGISPGVFNVILPGNPNRIVDSWSINVFSVSGFDVHRFGGLFVEPSWYGAFLGFFFCVYSYLVKKGVVCRRILLDFFVVLSVALTLSFSALIIVLWGFLYRCLSIKNIFWLVVVCCLFLALLLKNDYFSHRINLMISGSDGSTNARLYGSFFKSFELVKSSGGLGVGPGNTVRTIEELFGSNTSIQVAYLEILASLGVVGILVFLGLVHGSALKGKLLPIHFALFLSLSVSSVVFSSGIWLMSFFLVLLSRSYIPRGAFYRV